tara:strand:+ start:76 stop:486 length:411 start_codon:yes stop_codon:yes gene_type:complete
MRLIILFFFLINFSIAQKSELTAAILAFNKGDNVIAKEFIDISYEKYMKTKKAEKPKTMSKFWHYRGQIYFRIANIDISVKSFVKDIDLNAKGGYQKKSMTMLKRMGLSSDMINLLILEDIKKDSKPNTTQEKLEF